MRCFLDAGDGVKGLLNRLLEGRPREMLRLPSGSLNPGVKLLLVLLLKRQGFLLNLQLLGADFGGVPTVSVGDGKGLRGLLGLDGDHRLRPLAGKVRALGRRHQAGGSFRSGAYFGPELDLEHV